MPAVIVLGAGVSGLGCARELAAAHADFLVFDAAAHPGGHCWSHSGGGAWFDEGAHICHSHDEAFRALVFGGCPVVPHQQSRVSNYRAGAWFTYPVQNHLHELPSDQREAALGDLLDAQSRVPSELPEDYEAWCRANYGTYLTEHFYGQYTAKYWRVPMRDLSTDWLSGRVLPVDVERVLAGAAGPRTERQAAFARFWYPQRGGFFSLFAPLYQGLPITLGEPAVAIDWRRRQVTFASGRREGYDALASSVPLPRLVEFLVDAPDEIRTAAARLRHTQLLCVNLVVRVPVARDCDWFYVYDEDLPPARVSIKSNLAQGDLPPGYTALQAEIFRRADEPLPIDELVPTTTSALARILGFDPRRDLTYVGHVHVPWAYVIADHARATAVNRLQGWLAEQRVFTMGLYGRWKYVWSDDAFRQGEACARSILKP